MTLPQDTAKKVTGPIGCYLLFGLLLCLPLTSRSAFGDNEAPLRTTFIKQFKDKDAAKRVEAVKTLASVQEEKSVALLASALKDSSKDVREAAADTLQSATDGAGAATKPLCNVLANKKEDVKVRLAAAKALSKGSYKSDPVKAFIVAISLDESEFSLYEFGTECVKLLNALTGQDFGATKETPDLWKKWYGENEQKLAKEDQQTLAAYKKASAGKGT